MRIPHTRPYYFTTTLWLTVALLFLLLFSGTDCKKNPIVPPGPDTTSHNFSFTQYVFGGQGGSSYFKDCAIVSDTEIWAVGAIYTDSGFFNAARWNGKVWELERIPQNLYNDNCSLAGSAYGTLQTVFAFNDGNVILTSGGDFILWNGSSFSHLPCPNSAANTGISKLWGINENDFYAVGATGTIIHYFNTAWTKLASGTTLDIYDIYGSGGEILAVASQVGSSFDRAILSIQGTTVTKVADTPIAYPLQGIWFVQGKHYYVVGSGIYEKEKLTDSAWADSVLEFTQYYTTSVRGNATNDVFVAGSFGELLHWNGTTWKSFRDQTAISNGGYGRNAVKENLVVAVGEDAPRGVIVVGRR